MAKDLTQFQREVEEIRRDAPGFKNTWKSVEELVVKVFSKYDVSEEDSREYLGRLHAKFPEIALKYLNRVDSGETYKFSTYFSWWAKTAAEEAEKHSKTNP